MTSLFSYFFEMSAVLVSQPNNWKSNKRGSRELLVGPICKYSTGILHGEMAVSSLNLERKPYNYRLEGLWRKSLNPHNLVPSTFLLCGCCAGNGHNTGKGGNMAVYCSTAATGFILGIHSQGEMHRIDQRGSTNLYYLNGKLNCGNLRLHL